MKDLSEILGEKKQYRSWMESAKWVAFLRQNSDDILGQLSQHIRFGYFQGQCLFLETEQYAWVNEIQFFKPQLIGKINGYLPAKNQIKDIKIRIQKSEDVAHEKLNNPHSKLSLEDKIKQEYERKLAKGWKLCPHCKITLTPDEYCQFCNLDFE